jgi:RelA/SpoT family protein
VTKSQINRLGERLRAGPVDDALLEQLQDFRVGYAGPMANAQILIKRALGLDATARLKTVNTTLEKLRREKTRLSSVQDIAGLRLVGDWTLDEQDAVAAQLLTLFPGAIVRDRRSTPSNGYRGVHVIPTVEGYPLEIQVRTLYQDGWAQAMEKLADIVGRDIRYGGSPTRGGAVVARLVQMLMGFSVTLARHEATHAQISSNPAELSRMEAALRKSTATGRERADLEAGLAGLRAGLPEVVRANEEAVIAMQAAFASFAGLLERLDAILASEGGVQ